MFVITGAANSDCTGHTRHDDASSPAATVFIIFLFNPLYCI